MFPLPRLRWLGSGRGKAVVRRQASDSGRRYRAGRIVTWCSWLYLLGVLLVWALLSLAADRWWPATLILYGPRWVWALPAGFLLPAAAVVRPRLLWLPLIGLAVIVGPVMDFRVPLRL